MMLMMILTQASHYHKQQQQQQNPNLILMKIYSKKIADLNGLHGEVKLF
jgi:hypothetical protein